MPTALPELAGESRIKVVTYPLPRTISLYTNLTTPVLSDPRIREAIDRPALATQVLGYSATAAEQPCRGRASTLSSMSVPPDPTLTYHTSAEAVGLMDELCGVYADAYGAVPGEDIDQKSSAFRERASTALRGVNYSLVSAHAGDEMVGFAFGYSLQPESGWWDGLSPAPPEGFLKETGSRTVVLSEIEVRRARQGKGLGRAVHDAFLSQRAEERATLASNPKAVDTHALYEHWGWQKMGIVPDQRGSYYREYVLFVLELPLATRGR